MLAEEAEAAWKQSLALMAESKYPSEKEMYEREAAEELENMIRPKLDETGECHSVQSEGRKGKAGFETELSGRRNDESGSGGQKGRNLYEPVYSNPVQKEKVLLNFLAVWFRFKVAWKNWRKIFIKMSQFGAK